MISEKQLPELRVYRTLESTLHVEPEVRYETLVVSGTNDRLPVHRWFKFKESFSADLLATMLKSLELPSTDHLRILDPFCGAGTTLLSAQEVSKTFPIAAVGVEQNPFIHFVAQTKVNWPAMNAEAITAIGAKALETVGVTTPEIPPLSSLTTGRCLDTRITRRLLKVIHAVRSDGDSVNHHAVLLGIAASIEQLSKVRKDGRALRIVSKGRRNSKNALLTKWRDIASDVRFMQQTLPNTSIPTVNFGDGRSLAGKCAADSSVDLVLTSPPYPNNIDYSEVYKLELWLLGFITNMHEFLLLRRSTFRSHPTMRLPPLPDDFVKLIGRGSLKQLIGPILRRTKSSSEPHRHRVILGYALDLWTSLQHQFRALRRRGVAAIVVGNSLHGGKHVPYLVPTDLLVSAIGKDVGFEVERVSVARNLRRRLAGNHFLRESVIILRKP